jgi:hypothetical protein
LEKSPKSGCDGVSACRRIGTGAQQKIHTQVTEVRKGDEGLKGFRVYEELDFARFGALAYILCRSPTLAAFVWICYSPTRRHADTPTRRYAGTPTRFSRLPAQASRLGISAAKVAKDSADSSGNG